MYYDVVLSVYQEIGTNNCCDARVDSHLLTGGFTTEDEAITFIDSDSCKKTANELNEKLSLSALNRYSYIEVEENNDDGSLADVIAVD
jgi:hypothetical protein